MSRGKKMCSLTRNGVCGLLEYIGNGTGALESTLLGHPPLYPPFTFSTDAVFARPLIKRRDT